MDTVIVRMERKDTAAQKVSSLRKTVHCLIQF